MISLRSKKNSFLAVVLMAIGFTATVAIYLILIDPMNPGKREARTHQIVENAQGFEPSSLIIKLGDSVEFSTKLNKPFWPASDLHPSHGIYPEFDPKTPIDPKANWSFRFDREGEWKYHDHLYSAYRGVIIVDSSETLGIFSSKTKEVFACGDELGVQCFEQYIAAAMSEGGIDAAFDVVRSFYDKEPSFANNCHDYLHKVGEAAFRLHEQKKLASILPQSEMSFCSYGFFHGFMEALLLHSSSPEKAGAWCAQMTADLPVEDHDACYHGLGHGAMGMSEYDTSRHGEAQKMLDGALHLCLEATDSPLRYARCASGVFMQLSNDYLKGSFGLSVDKGDPLRICREQEEMNKMDCYTQMNGVLNSAAGGDLLRGAEFLDEVPDLYAGEAMQTFASVIVPLDKGDMQDIAISCHEMSDRLRPYCVKGIAQAYFMRGKPGREYENALDFCSNELLSRDDHLACYEFLKKHMANVYPQETLEDICSNIEAGTRKLICNKS